MKTILVPVDFSGDSANAARYAADLALNFNAEIILYHVFQIPVPMGDMIMLMITEEEMRDAAVKRLQKLQKKTENHVQNKIVVKTKVIFGNTVEWIEEGCRTYQADLVVMGSKGTGHLAGVLFGNVTYSLISRANCPLLVIPDGVRYRDIKKVVVATMQDTLSVREVPLLSMLVEEYTPHVILVSITDKPETVAAMEDNPLDPPGHTVHYYWIDKDVSRGITDFAEEHHADLVIMFPQPHGFWDKLLSRGATGNVSLLSTRPLLSIPLQVN